MVFTVNNKISKVYDHRFYQAANENPFRAKTIGSRQPCGVIQGGRIPASAGIPQTKCSLSLPKTTTAPRHLPLPLKLPASWLSLYTPDLSLSLSKQPLIKLVLSRPLLSTGLQGQEEPSPPFSPTLYSLMQPENTVSSITESLAAPSHEPWTKSPPPPLCLTHTPALPLSSF